MKDGEVFVFDDLSVSKSANGGYITVSSDELDWNVRFGKNIPIFKSIEQLMDMEDGEAKEASIKGLCSYWIFSTTVMGDEEFIQGNIKLMEEYHERVRAFEESISDTDVNNVIKISEQA